MTASAKIAPRTKRRAGRPTKLTARLQTEICELIAGGVPSEDAAVSVGIARRTFFDWLERGRNGDPLYADFQLAVDEAFAVFHVTTVAQATADPKNAMAILEKRFNKAWGRTDRLAVDVSVSQRPFVDLEKLELGEAIELQRLMRKAAPDADQLPKDGVPATELLAASIDGVVLREEIVE